MTTADPRQTKDGQTIRPGVVLRAMGASEKALTPVFDDVAGGEAPPGAAPPQAAGTPQLDVRENGDQVTQIVVRCTCGREIAIDCDYGDADR